MIGKLINRNRAKKFFQVFLPTLLVLTFFSLIYFFDVSTIFSLDNLKNNYQILLNYVDRFFFQSIIMYMLAYIFSVVLCLPIATFLTILAGFLFGSTIGTMLAVGSATIGASITLVLVNFSFYSFFSKVSDNVFPKFKKGFNKNAFLYLIFLRLVPVFPFFLVNIFSGLMGIRLQLFISATLIGMLPASFVYVSFGSGASFLINDYGMYSYRIFTQKEILFPLLGFVILVFLPLSYKLIRKIYSE